MALRIKIISMAMTVAICITSSNASALAVFDSANFIENQLTRLKTVEQLSYVINTYNEIKSYMNWIGQIRDMANGFVTEPMRVVNEMTNCLNVMTNTPATNLCGEQYRVFSEYFATPAPTGELGDSTVTNVRLARDSGLQDSVQRAIALARYIRKDPKISQRIVDLAAEAGSPTSSSAQSNITNKLLVELIIQQQKTNTLLSAILELEGNRTAQQIPIGVGISNSRFGIKISP